VNPKIAATTLPPHWRGVRRSKSGAQKGLELFFFDTETVYGKVFAISCADESQHARGEFEISHGLGKDHLSFLLDRILSLPGNGRRSPVVAAHNLRFDLAGLFFDVLNPLHLERDRAPKSSFFSLLSHRCEVEIFWTRPCFGRIRHEGRTFHLIDTLAFFTMGLGAALEMLGAEYQKLPKPHLLGERVIPLKELLPYSKNDTLGGMVLLKEIRSLHEKYECRLCVSLPQLASRIFRHDYLAGDFAIPTKPLLRGALLSYHGGKNSFPARPGYFKGVYDLDINSAYSEAMAFLPDFERGRWRLGSGRSFFKRHPHGVFRISGRLRECPWGCLQTHSFKKAVGVVRGLWATGYEISEGLRSRELELEKIQGYGFEEGIRPKKYRGTALSRYVADFFKKKAEAKNPGERYFYKLLQNALYGKFIQRTEDDDGSFIAGSMFDPAVASLITGFVRAKIHRLEHRYNALHTATDGFITRRRPFKKDIGDGIGQLKASEKGDVLILRNKLYLFFSQKTGKLIKAGLHGFQTNIGESQIEAAARLKKLYESGKRVYHVDRLVKWSEAWHGQFPPGFPRKGLKRALILS
jgi:hypothetical protein